MILVKKNPIDGPPLNLEIADLRHCWVGDLREARQPNGVAANGTGRKLDGRGFNSRYDQIEDSLRKNQTLDEIWTVFCGPFWSKTCFAALVLKYSSFVWRDSSGSTHLTTGRQMAGLVEFNWYTQWSTGTPPCRRAKRGDCQI